VVLKGVVLRADPGSVRGRRATTSMQEHFGRGADGRGDYRSACRGIGIYGAEGVVRLEQRGTVPGWLGCFLGWCDSLRVAVIASAYLTRSRAPFLNSEGGTSLPVSGTVLYQAGLVIQQTRGGEHKVQNWMVVRTDRGDWAACWRSGGATACRRILEAGGRRMVKAVELRWKAGGRVTGVWELAEPEPAATPHVHTEGDGWYNR